MSWSRTTMPRRGGWLGRDPDVQIWLCGAGHRSAYNLGSVLTARPYDRWGRERLRRMN